MKNRQRVAVGMSGGIDSTVAAAVCLQMGYAVVGVTMRVYSGALSQVNAAAEHSPQMAYPQSTTHACYGPDEEQEIQQASGLAKSIGIPHHVIDLREEYRKIVLAHFAKEYLAGRTPNPCVVCNNQIKFNLLPHTARRKGLAFDLFATGHYCRLEYGDPRFGNRTQQRYMLRRAFDASKDQSYFLYRLTQERLAMSLFPLGQFTKDQVRTRARELGVEFDPADESQDFAALDYTTLLPAGGSVPGKIMDTRGRELGTHRGIAHYTVGQRRGLGISHPEPLYVARIDADENRIIVDTEGGLLRQSCRASHLNWVSVCPPTSAMEVTAQIRSLHAGAEAVVAPEKGDTMSVHFGEAQKAIAPGQSIVFYHGDLLLGGGTIM